MSPGADGAPENPTPIRSSERRERADEWALVLAAEGLHPRVTRAPQGNVLSVPEHEAEHALRTLEDWERENPPAPRVEVAPAPPAGPASWRVAALIATALLGFFRVTGPSRGGSAWFEVGASDTDLVLSGEVWRVVTALTLHADLAHVLGNCLAGAFFLTAVGRSLGPGLALALTIAAGALGNLANAILHGADHSSVGASTSVFGAVGLLAGLGVGHSLQRGTPARRVWLPVGAGLALVAMLGTGVRVDIWAHVLGVLCGAALGAIAGAGRPGRPAPWLQWAIGLAALALVVGCWSWGFSALQSSSRDALVSAVQTPLSTSSTDLAAALDSDPALPAVPPHSAGLERDPALPTVPPRSAGLERDPTLPTVPPRVPEHVGQTRAAPRRRPRRWRSLRRRAKHAVLAPLLSLAGGALPWLYRGYMGLVWRTSRIEDIGVSGVASIAAEHDGVVALLWHEEVATAPWAYPRLGFRPHTLASVSDSGQIVTRVLEACGYRVFRGGSSRRESRRRHTVLARMIEHMRGRDDVIYGITVDGSHGPAFRMKRGGAFIARETGRPVVLVRTWTRRHLRLRSWDRMAIPLPWNEIRHSMRGPYAVPEDAHTRAGFERFCERLEADLQSLAAESYRAFEQPVPDALRGARPAETR